MTNGVNLVGGVWVVASTADSSHASVATRTVPDGSFTLHGLSAIGYKVGFFDPTGAHSPLVYGQQNRVDLAQGTTVTLEAGAGESVGEVALPDADLRNCPLDGLDLQNAYLKGSNLDGASLRNANLHGTGRG